MARKVSLILDIGASIGNFASDMRTYGYKNKIYSFEPILESYLVLKKRSFGDKIWSVFNAAVLNIDSEIEFNISDNLVSSSFLQMKQEHLDSEPKSRFVEKRLVRVLDIKKIIESTKQNSEKLFLKLDTQGSEFQILCEISDWGSISGIRLETSIKSLYENSPTYLDHIEFLTERNFELFDIVPGFRDPSTGKLLQADLIFFKL